MNKFKCPKCDRPIPIKELFNFNKKHQTVCNNCKITMKPKNIKSWNWGFIIGFATFVIPAKISLLYNDNYLMAAIIGFAGGTIGIISVALYTYLTTEFEEM